MPRLLPTTLDWDKALPVLVVDDDHSVRLALADLLTRWGVRFDVAEDGGQALGLVEGGQRYGLILADYRLPGALDGLALIGEIARRHGGKPPVAVLVTADFDPRADGGGRAAAVSGAAEAAGCPPCCAGCSGSRRRFGAEWRWWVGASTGGLPGGSPPFSFPRAGRMAERLKAHAWKACVRESVPWVRIPLLPPEYRLKLLKILASCRCYFVT